MKPRVLFNPSLPGIRNWTVERLTWRLPGGAFIASVRAALSANDTPDPATLPGWLGQPLEIHDPQGMTLWNGWVEQIRLTDGSISRTFSTRNLLSRVRARCPQADPPGGALNRWEYTTWLEDPARLEQLGAKEALLSLQQPGLARANQAARMVLNRSGFENTLSVRLLREPQPASLELTLRGWWQRLNWTLDGEASGLIAHLPGGKAHQPCGTLASQRLAQSFLTPATGFAIGRAALRLSMLGDAADDLNLKIHADQAGSPAAEIGAASLPNALLHGGWQWQEFVFDPPLNLAGNTRYWLALERAGAPDGSAYFQAESDDGRGYPDGECRQWNGSAWLPVNQDLRFTLQAVAQTSGLIAEAAYQAITGGVLAGAQIWQESGIFQPVWRLPEQTRLEAIEGWLCLGTAEQTRLSAIVDQRRMLQVFAVPRAIEPALKISYQEKLRLSSGAALPPALDLLGRNLTLPGFSAARQHLLTGMTWTAEDGLFVDGLG